MILSAIPSVAREPYQLLCSEGTEMSRASIFTIFILVDLAIVFGVVFCVFQHVPVSKYFWPAVLLFMLNGVWLVVMTVRKTPPRQ